MGRARTPASSGGKDLLSSWPSGTPTDASGAFRSNPRPSTKAFIPFFQIAKLLPTPLFLTFFLDFRLRWKDNLKCYNLDDLIKNRERVIASESEAISFL